MNGYFILTQERQNPIAWEQGPFEVSENTKTTIDVEGINAARLRIDGNNLREITVSIFSLKEDLDAFMAERNFSYDDYPIQ